MDRGPVVALSALALAVAACNDRLDLRSGTTGMRRVKLTFAAPPVEALDGFPLLVRLNSSRIEYTRTQEAGQDLRFTDAAGTSLPHEIERWDEAGESIVWVRIPRLEPASGRFIWIGYGDPAAADGQNAAALWAPDFVAVWHLGDSVPGTVRDSAGGHDGAAAGASSPAQVAGMVGDALEFTDTEFVDVPKDPDFELPIYTWSAWIWAPDDPSVATNGANGQPVFNADDQFNFTWHHSTPSVCATASHAGANGPVHALTSGSLVGQTWYHVAGTYDGLTLRGYADGIQGAAIAAEPPLVVPGAHFGIGNDPAAPGFIGRVDELRVSRVARSVTWMATENASMRDAIITFGPPEAAP